MLPGDGCHVATALPYPEYPPLRQECPPYRIRESGSQCPTHIWP